MNIIERKEPGDPEYPKYIAKTGFLIFGLVFGLGFLIIAGVAIYASFSL